MRAVLLVLAFLLLLSQGCIVAVADWNQFRNDTRNTGVSQEMGPVEDVGFEWVTRTKERVISSPAVVDGRVYVGSHDDRMYALNASTGEPVWSFGTEGDVWSSPAVHDGTVYFGSTGGALYALDASKRETVWEFRTDQVIAASPTLDDGTVFVGTRGESMYEPEENTTFRMYGIDASTGDTVWHREMDVGVFSSAAVVDGVVYVGSGDGHVYALESSDGDTVWRFDTGEIVGSSPAVVDGRVYVGSHDDRMYALNASTGEPVWSYQTDGNIVSSPAVAKDSVYFGSYDEHVYALNATTGKLSWKFETPGSVSKSSPAVATDTDADGNSSTVVYVGSRGGGMYALNVSTGEPVWTIDTSPVLSSPAVANGDLFFGTLGGEVFSVAEDSSLKRQGITGSSTVEEVNSTSTANRSTDVDHPPRTEPPGVAPSHLVFIAFLTVLAIAAALRAAGWD